MESYSDISVLDNLYIDDKDKLKPSCILTWFVFGNIEQCPDVERSIRFVVEVVARFVIDVADISVKFLMHITGDVLWFHQPQSLENKNIA